MRIAKILFVLEKTMIMEQMQLAFKGGTMS